MSGPKQPPIRVVVHDAETDEVLAEQIVEDDYALITAGTCYVEHTNVYGNGTHVLTVKGRRP